MCSRMPFALVLFLPAKSALFVLTGRAITTDAFLPSYTRPFRDAYKNVLNALLAPSELAWPFKTLASPRMLGVVLCEVFSLALPRARSPTAIYVSRRIESRSPVASIAPHPPQGRLPRTLCYPAGCELRDPLFSGCCTCAAERSATLHPWHCLRTTLAEEGARPLWRAWWATWIGVNFTSWDEPG